MLAKCKNDPYAIFCVLLIAIHILFANNQSAQQSVNRASPLKISRSWNYYSILSEKMPLFIQIYHQLELIVVGDSRAAWGIDPLNFFDTTNQAYPQAFNFSIYSAGLPAVEIQIRDYAFNLPKLKWIVYGISPRIFNKEWLSSGKQWQLLTASPGYKFDMDNPDSIWVNDYGSLISPTPPDYCCQNMTFWGYPTDLADKDSGSWMSDFDNPETERKLKELVQNGTFSLSEERIAQFDSLLAALQSRGIYMLGYTPPMHYFIADQPCTDDDGTTREGYDLVVNFLEEMQVKYSNFIFIDIDNKANNDFSSDEFWNFDHLNSKGAKRLTQYLNQYILSSEIRRNKGVGYPSQFHNTYLSNEEIDIYTIQGSFIGSFPVKRMKYGILPEKIPSTLLIIKGKQSQKHLEFHFEPNDVFFDFHIIH
ncbi:MAG: hypothetical protein GF401_08530 [Chitinivibrionales bacterium]|nr:hypothetical protein [Chitinivibrionales bacterium]